MPRYPIKDGGAALCSDPEVALPQSIPWRVGCQNQDFFGGIQRTCDRFMVRGMCADIYRLCFWILIKYGVVEYKE